MYRLISIRISPFCELARWVLERRQIPFRESCHAPLLSLPFSWAAGRSLNVPVVVAPDATLEIQQFPGDRDDRARANGKILPQDRQERQPIWCSKPARRPLTVNGYAGIWTAISEDSKKPAAMQATTAGQHALQI